MPLPKLPAVLALPLALALAATAPRLWAQHAQPDQSEEHDRGRHHEDADDDADVVEPDDGDGVQIDTTIPFASSGGVVDLTLISGEITVSGWTRNEAHIHVSSDQMPVRFEHGPDRILLDIRTHRHMRNDDGDVQYALTVPVGTRVIMHSVSGDLRSQGTHGEIEARSVSGDVEIDDVVRTATLESVSGNVTVRNVQGDLHARTVSGDVDADRIGGNVTISSVSGHGAVTNAKSRALRMETVSGDLTYRGTFDPTGTYDLHAHSGNVHLELPADVGASISIDTFSGDIRTDFPMTIQPSGDDPGLSRHHMDTTLGKGGAHITVATFSGDVELQKLAGGSGR